MAMEEPKTDSAPVITNRPKLVPVETPPARQQRQILYRASDGTQYIKHPDGSLRRRFPKVKGKKRKKSARLNDSAHA